MWSYSLYILLIAGWRWRFWRGEVCVMTPTNQQKRLDQTTRKWMQTLWVSVCQLHDLSPLSLETPKCPYVNKPILYRKGPGSCRWENPGRFSPAEWNAPDEGWHWNADRTLLKNYSWVLLSHGCDTTPPEVLSLLSPRMNCPVIFSPYWLIIARLNCTDLPGRGM